MVSQFYYESLLLGVTKTQELPGVMSQRVSFLGCIILFVYRCEDGNKSQGPKPNSGVSFKTHWSSLKNYSTKISVRRDFWPCFVGDMRVYNSLITPDGERRDFPIEWDRYSRGVRLWETVGRVTTRGSWGTSRTFRPFPNGGVRPVVAAISRRAPTSKHSGDHRRPHWTEKIPWVIFESLQREPFGRTHCGPSLEKYFAEPRAEGKEFRKPSGIYAMGELLRGWRIPRGGGSHNVEPR